ncbi:PhoU family transcriptional regulator [Mycoplasma sp. NEAQ87857]|uniref:PhoU domain-containing protein n=1 Tax=Mycoplasma sp. NEAQ87857 TaxID=2683967 RepID=UPI001317C0C9|nr:PhoU domain-containing protein [Mycoplasma sp. NEAQ87857]QGZ97623.1 PhoU family transcriptional regulator [Mycoplasma sp. NEAQ87857]
MAINFTLLKKDEKIIKKQFMDYVAHSITMNQHLINVINQINSNLTNDESFVKIYNLEQESNHMHQTILDDAVWLISKEQPIANHLRYFISIINSLFDIERICDYSDRIARFLEKEINKTSNYEYDLMISLITQVVEFGQMIYDALDSHNVEQIYLELKVKYDLFVNMYKSKTKEILNHSNINQMHLLSFFTLLKSVDRAVDHYINILENFIFVNDINFFNKHKKIN